MKLSKHKKFVISLSKFAASSLVATVVDVLLFTYVFTKFLTVFQSEILAGFIGMCINFILQKRYVFKLKRNQYIAFGMSIGLSIVALFLGGFLIDALVEVPLFATYLILPKLIVISFKFFFNYFTKRWVFEKKGLKGWD